MKELVAILKAASFAAGRHRDQRRKDADASPYINHPLAVANVLASEGGVTDESLLIAALLHDTVEDTQTTFEEIEALYGPTVRHLVEEMTDEQHLRKEVRKRLQVQNAPESSDLAKQLRIADKICNVRDIAGSPPANWSESRKIEYLEWANQVVEGCRGVNSRLDRVYDEAVAMVRRKLGLEEPEGA